MVYSLVLWSMVFFLAMGRLAMVESRSYWVMVLGHPNVEVPLILFIVSILALVGRKSILQMMKIEVPFQLAFPCTYKDLIGKIFPSF